MKKNLVFIAIAIALFIISGFNFHLNRIEKSVFSTLTLERISAYTSECENTVTKSGSTYVTKVCDSKSIKNAQKEKRYCTVPWKGSTCWYDNKGNGMG
jgi:hypothetical protein